MVRLTHKASPSAYVLAAPPHGHQLYLSAFTPWLLWGGWIFLTWRSSGWIAKPVYCPRADSHGVSAGEYNALSISSEGDLWGWGYNYYSQSGNSTITIADLLRPSLVNSVALEWQNGCLLQREIHTV